MRALLDIRFPHEQFNEAVRNGTAGAKIEKILATLNPEAVYFTEREGRRTALIVVDVPDASKIPSLAEPWFLTFNADFRVRILMSADDLKKSGLEQLGKQWG